MEIGEAKRQLERLFACYPTLRTSIERSATPAATRDAWANMLARLHPGDLAGVVDDLLAGRQPIPSMWDRLPQFICDLAALAGAQRARREQADKSHQQHVDACRGALRAVTRWHAGHVAIELGRLVAAGQLSREENDRRLADLLAWDNQGREDGLRPDWLDEITGRPAERILRHAD